MGRAGILVLLGLLGFALSGCGEETPQDPSASQSNASPSPEVPEGPVCAEVWVDGASIPGSYKGCVDADTWVAAEATRCDSGQVLVVYGDRFYGAKGAIVNDVGGPLDDSDQYRRAVRSCG
jgi:hypothetical protein